MESSGFIFFFYVIIIIIIIIIIKKIKLYFKYSEQNRYLQVKV